MYGHISELGMILVRNDILGIEFPNANRAGICLASESVNDASHLGGHHKALIL